MLPILLAALLSSETVHVRGNPILSNGRAYSTDPAPLVDGDTLWILAGRDEAPDGVNDFIMNEWQLLSTKDPASGVWRHDPAIARPEAVFAWAAPGTKDRFAIGVAVADRPTGPWRDAHPQGPIISQSVPVANAIQNIDPTVLIDDDGRIYIYWGTFGRLRAMELAPDMVTPKGPEQVVTGATGFFEAPSIMKRRGTYYLLYAANNAGPDSPCTPAFIMRARPMPPRPRRWGPGPIAGSCCAPCPRPPPMRGRWNSKGGGHFRRSVAIDPMAWDDSVSPPAIRPVTPTKAPAPPPPPTRNRALSAWATTSNAPVPVQYWIAALNDGVVAPHRCPPICGATGPALIRPAPGSNIAGPGR